MVEFLFFPEAQDDLPVIIEYLHDLTKPIFKMLGLQLGLRYGTLEQLSVVADDREYGMKVLCAWLRQEDNVRQMGQPTWDTLALALNKDSVDGKVQRDRILKGQYLV